jgi:hypothetical protein
MINQKKSPSKDYYLEILIRKTYHIKAITRDKAESILHTVKVNELDIDAADKDSLIEKIEDQVIKKRLLSNSQNAISKGKGTAKRTSWN